MNKSLNKDFIPPTPPTAIMTPADTVRDISKFIFIFLLTHF